MKMRVVWRLVVMVGLMLSMFVGSASAGQFWLPSNTNGFGTSDNVVVYSLASFGGQLYAGTVNESGSGCQLWRLANGAWSSITTNGFGSTANKGFDHLSEFDGQLYASTYNDANGGEIWRSSTGNAGSWTRVVAGGFGDVNNGEIMRMTEFSSTLYATTWSYTTTHGSEIWRSDTGNSASWTRVMTNGFGDAHNSVVLALEDLNGYLYAGTYNFDLDAGTSTGGEVWRTSNGTSWLQVNADGFGDAGNVGVGALAEFNGYLYASTYHTSGSGSQVWRCQTCDAPGSWQKVADNGFGNVATRGMNALEVYSNTLYFVVGNNTNGLEVWRTSNGTQWTQVGFGGFGDAHNLAPYWDNSTAIFDNDLYVGTWNGTTGGQVWRYHTLNQQVFLPLARK